MDAVRLTDDQMRTFIRDGYITVRPDLPREYHDEMFAKLVENKHEDYADYTPENFQSEVERHFTIADRMTLKGGKREILLLTP